MGEYLRHLFRSYRAGMQMGESEPVKRGGVFHAAAEDYCSVRRTPVHVVQAVKCRYRQWQVLYGIIDPRGCEYYDIPLSGSPRAMRSVAGTMLNFSIGRALGTTFMLASRMRLLLRHSPASQLLTGIKVTGTSE